MSKRRIIFTLAVLCFAACSPYNAPRLPTGQSDSLQYRIVPITAAASTQWQAQARQASPTQRSHAKTQTPYDYILGAGDMISLIIYTFDAKGEQSAIRVFPEGLPIAGEDEFLVAADGTIILPYVGRILVQGKPFAQVERIIERGLANYFIQPQFKINVTEFAFGRVLVTGEVENPGEQRLSHQALTVSGAIEAAGGLLTTADLSAATLTRADGTSQPLNLYGLYYEQEQSANHVLRSGDKLTIARGHGNQIFMAGELVNPQAITMHPSGFSLAEALQQAGGASPITGDWSDIYVLRMTSPPAATRGQLVIYHLDATNLANLALAGNFAVRPRDIIYVSQQPITVWDRILTQFLPGGLSTIIGPQFNK